MRASETRNILLLIGDNMELPRFESYGDCSSKNYGVNCLRFTDSFGNSFWFSYKTLVAFSGPGIPLVCRENEWGPTTGKHLNQIEPDKKRRVSCEVFQKLFQESFKGCNVDIEA